MKFIKTVLVFVFIHFALPTGYCLVLPKSQQDSIKQKRKITNQEVLDMFELVQGVTSVAGGTAISMLGNKLFRTNLLVTMTFGKFFIVLGAVGFIIGALLLIHFFVRQRKKKRGK